MADLKLDLSWDNLDEAFASLEQEITDVVRGLSVVLFQQVVLRTPQYLGRMAASYTYSLNAPVYVDRSFLFGDEIEGQFQSKPWITKPSSKGGVKAVNLASLYNQGKPDRFKLGDTVYISNGVDHGEGAYSGAVESGEVKLRAVNRPGNAVHRSLTYINALYGKNVSYAAALKLRAAQITDY